MKSEIQINTDQPQELKKSVQRSLESDQGVRIELDTNKNSVEATVRAETLGRLRGGTDAVFRLTGLAKKILER